MSPQEFNLLLDDMLELDPGTITGTEQLADLENWDSLAVISFIALADEHFGTLVEGRKLTAAKTVGDLYTLVYQAKAA